MDTQRDAAVYNIKAVTKLTGIPADTLRRWESRYQVIVPQRSESGYRLYSQRDVDTILWLKARLDEGLSISRACELLTHSGGIGQAAPPASLTPMGSAAPQSSVQSLQLPELRQPGSAVVRSFEKLQAELFNAFIEVNEARAREIVGEALNLYSVEDLCMQVLQPVLVQIGEAWLSGEATVAVEHFASSFVRARLENLFHTSPYNPNGPLVLVGCAPEELHELGAMFLAIFLRRSGYRVVYLGQNVPLDSLMGMVHAMKPDALCISSTRAETAAALYSLRDLLDQMQQREGYAPLLAYGGRVFNRFPHITQHLGGIYLGEDARLAVHKITEKLRGQAQG